MCPKALFQLNCNSFPRKNGYMHIGVDDGQLCDSSHASENTHIHTSRAHPVLWLRSITNDDYLKKSPYCFLWGKMLIKYPFWMSKDMYNKFLKIFLNDIKVLLAYIKSLCFPKNLYIET